MAQVVEGSEKFFSTNDKGRLYRIHGSHLRFLLDFTGLSLSQLENRVFRITSNSMGTGGIENPKFPEGVNLKIALARLVATILCDGSIHRSKNGVSYFESNIHRIAKFELGLQDFGNIQLNPIWDEEDGIYTCYLSEVISIITKYLGLKEGDKTIQNPIVKSKFIEGLSWRALCAMIEDIIPEDGTFVPWYFSCTHSMALHAGEKDGMYTFNPLIGEKEIELVKTGKFIQDGEVVQARWVLPFGKVIRLMDTEDTSASAARQLFEVVNNNPSNFILNEARVLERLGIAAYVRPISVYYYVKSERVSVAWKWSVTGNDAIKLGIIAPPNDVVKREKVRKWLKSKPEAVKMIVKELVEQAISFDFWWFDDFG